MAVGELVVEQTDEAFVIALDGEHDLSGEPDLRSELVRGLRSSSRRVVDLSPVTFIDSTVLAAIVDAHVAARRTDVRFGVIAPSGGVAKRLLMLCGLDARIPVFETRADAFLADERGRTGAAGQQL